MSEGRVLPDVVPSWEFADRIRKIRMYHTRWNQKQMAAALEVGSPRYEAWESGRNEPRPALAEQLAYRLQALTGVPAWWTLDQDPPIGRQRRKDTT